MRPSAVRERERLLPAPLQPSWRSRLDNEESAPARRRGAATTRVGALRGPSAEARKLARHVVPHYGSSVTLGVDGHPRDGGRPRDGGGAGLEVKK